MNDISLADVRRLLEVANTARLRRGGSDSTSQSNGREGEDRLDALFRTNHRLAAYGTLAPGRSNYHIVARLGGEWTEGIVEGELFPQGWGATLGYPAFRPHRGGPAVPVHVLTAPSLESAWPDLDRFEGPGYQRILVPVFRAEPGPDGTGQKVLYTVANLYAASEPGSS